MRIDGKKLADSILVSVKGRVTQLKNQGVVPHLAVLIVGNDKPSHSYVRIKQRTAERLGFLVTVKKMRSDSSQDEITHTLKSLHKLPHICGIVLQLPLPDKKQTQFLLDTIDPTLDIDCLTTENITKLESADKLSDLLLPPTPAAILSILDSLSVDLDSQHVCIVGTGMLVGAPLAQLLRDKVASLTLCNKNTKDLRSACKYADILITATGKKGLITGDYVKPGSIVIDAGVSFQNSKMFGDVDMKTVEPVAAHVTPTPGGVGPLTVAHLLLNATVVAEAKYSL